MSALTAPWIARRSRVSPRLHSAAQDGVLHRKLATVISLLLQCKLLTVAELLRLNALPRYARTSSRLLGRRMVIPDAFSFIPMYVEIFENEIYKFETAEPRPLIIDGGANIGASVLYFKKILPGCRVVAFEPDPGLADILETNLKTFKAATDVEVVRAALWDRDGDVSFLPDGGDAGRIAQPEDSGDLVSVPTRRLRDYLRQPIALLKLDIEGAETDVLRDCRDALGAVERIFVEYHSFAGAVQTLDELLRTLNEAGFRYQILPARTPPNQPFTSRRTDMGMDMQLNIFAYREEQSRPVRPSERQLVASAP